MKRRYKPVDRFTFFKTGKLTGFSYYFKDLYVYLFRLSFGITGHKNAAMNIVVDAWSTAYEYKLQFETPEQLKGLMRDIVEQNSHIYRRLQRIISGKKEEILPVDEIYAGILEDILDMKAMDDILDMKATMEKDLFQKMQIHPDDDQQTFHELIIEGKSISVLAKERNMTKNAIGIKRANAVSNIFLKLSKSGLILIFFYLVN